MKTTSLFCLFLLYAPPIHAMNSQKSESILSQAGYDSSDRDDQYDAADALEATQVQLAEFHIDDQKKIKDWEQEQSQRNLDLHLESCDAYLKNCSQMKSVDLPYEKWLVDRLDALNGTTRSHLKAKLVLSWQFQARKARKDTK